MTLTTRPCEEHHFQTHDGVSLFFRRWPATTERLGAVVMFHRGHEHSGRMAHLVDAFDRPEFDFYAWDARGHGRSPGARGDAPDFAHLVRDVQSFIEHIRANWQLAEEDIAVLAQSVGAVIVATWAHDYAPRVRCLLLAAPAFQVKLYVPLARPAIRLWRALRGNFFVKSYVKSKFLTHDPQRQASFDADPLISRAISANILLGLYEASERVVADAQAINMPTQLLISGSDWVVRHQPQYQFIERLGALEKECHLLPGFYHDTFGEQDRAQAIDKARDFLLRQFAKPWARPDLRHAHQSGATYEEARRLAAPLPLYSPRGLYWALFRALLRGAGHLSEGIATGQRTGFDSGSSLDYIYRNQPAGRGWPGRAIDRMYLSAIGWRGIRQRKRHLEALLCEALTTTRAEARPCRILDIAAGHGRYVLETVQRLAPDLRPESVLLRDFSELNVSAGTARIAEAGLADIARFVRGDAFDRADLAAIAPHPTIGIVSGLYELFGDNDQVAASLAGLHDALAEDGLLIYTGQPWHPQLEMIARALTSHRDGAPWVMRRRTQAEMDQLVREAGFTKITERVDPWGIFTVSLARRKTLPETPGN